MATDGPAPIEQVDTAPARSKGIFGRFRKSSPHPAEAKGAPAKETPLGDQIRVGQFAPEQVENPILNQALREQDERATERNKYRSLAQKLFGKGKVTGVDMAMEEAMRMSPLIDQEVESGAGMEEAVKKVSALPEFRLKGLKDIQKEEYVRARTLQFAHALEENKFLKAKVLRKFSQLGVDDITVGMYQDAVKAAINQRAADLVRQKDGDNFRKVVRGFGDDIQRDRMQITDEELRAPEIQDPIRKDLVDSFRYHTPFTPDKFAKQRDKLVGMGIVEGAEINRLPEIQQIARERLVGSFNYHTPFTPDTFVKERDALVKIGIMSVEEANQIPEIQEIAKQKMISSFRYHTPFTPDKFAKERDALVKMGILEAADIDKLPEIQEEARRKLVASYKYHTPYTPQSFAKERDELIALGIVDMKTVDAWVQEATAPLESLVTS